MAPPSAPSFQTTSLVIVVPLALSLVPPHASTLGLEAGKSAWAWPSFTPSLDPSSPGGDRDRDPQGGRSLKRLVKLLERLSGPA